MDANRVTIKYMENIMNLKTPLVQSEKDVVPLVVIFTRDEDVGELKQARCRARRYTCP